MGNLWPASSVTSTWKPSLLEGSQTQQPPVLLNLQKKHKCPEVGLPLLGS